MEQLVGTQPGVHVCQQAEIVRRVEALAFGQQAGCGEQLFDVLMALLVQFDLTGLLVDAEVPFTGNDAFFFLDVLLEARNQLVDLLIELGAVFGLARDD